MPPLTPDEKLGTVMDLFAPSHLLILVIIALIFLVHFLPTIIAVRRKHTNALGIFLVNLFLGWTLIGWVVALVWAVSKGDQTLVLPCVRCGTSPQSGVARFCQKCGAPLPVGHGAYNPN